MQAEKSKPRYRELLRTYLWPQRRRVLALGALLLVSTGLQLASPQVLRAYIDTARAGGEVTDLTRAAGLFLGMVVAVQVCSVLSTYTAQTVAWTSTNRLRRDLAEHCLRLDMGFHNDHTPGQMIERIDGDAGTVANFLSTFVLKIVSNALFMAGVLVVLVLQDWRLGLGFTVFAAVCLALLYRVRTLPTPYWREVREAATELYGFLEERLGGMEDVRANGATGYVLRGLHGGLQKHFRAVRTAIFMAWVPITILLCARGAGEGLVFGLGGWLLTDGAISLGTLFMASYFVTLLLWPMQALMDQIQDVQRAGVSLQRIEELFRTHSAVQGPGPAARPLGDGALSVEFERVSFGYAGTEAVLRDVTFRLEAGRVLGLLGRTGSGKTTIARLLARFYDPPAGAVRVGGADVRDLRPDELRRRIGMVTQDVQLFQASVRDNLTFFDAGVDDTLLLGVLEELGLSDWCRRLPQGLDTELAAAGGGLSAGEAQLVALARVFLKDPGLVILDEASSRLDPATERLVEGAIDRLLAGRTAIVIAHRLATVRRVDDILILDGGRVAEHGPRAVLEEDKHSRYARLLRVSRDLGLASVEEAVGTIEARGAAGAGSAPANPASAAQATEGAPA